MEKTYDPHAIEETWYQRWEDEGYFAARGEVMAYLSVITLPVLIFYLSLQRAFIQSIASSTVKI